MWEALLYVEIIFTSSFKQLKKEIPYKVHEGIRRWPPGRPQEQCGPQEEYMCRILI
jgi:hypothetical protein